MSNIPRVIVRLSGGLGNQMFQYAAARALSLRVGAELRLDKISGFEYDDWYKRKYSLANFNILENFADSGESYMGFFGRARRLLARRFPLSPAYISEGGGQYDEVLLGHKLSRSVYLDGYWQSEKYFNDISQLLRQEFSLRNPLSPEAKSMSDYIGRVDSVSMHVRRMYRIPGATRVVPADESMNIEHLCGVEYYSGAAKRIAAVVTNPHFFIFSDCPGWAESHIKLSHPVTFVPSSGDDKAFEDMTLMSLCRNHIIADSSFSWWGAWLGGNPDKIVCAPESALSKPHFLPAAWEVLTKKIQTS